MSFCMRARAPSHLWKRLVSQVLAQFLNRPARRRRPWSHSTCPRRRALFPLDALGAITTSSPSVGDLNGWFNIVFFLSKLKLRRCNSQAVILVLWLYVEICGNCNLGLLNNMFCHKPRKSWSKLELCLHNFSSRRICSMNLCVLTVQNSLVGFEGMKSVIVLIQVHAAILSSVYLWLVDPPAYPSSGLLICPRVKWFSSSDR